MRVSETRGKTVLKVILNCTERVDFIQYQTKYVSSINMNFFLPKVFKDINKTVSDKR